MAKTGSKLTDKSDAELIQQAIQDGSEEAYGILYLRYHESVMKKIRRYVPHSEEVEDICQETFSKAFSQLGSFRLDGNFATWIFTIARNTAFDHSSHDKARGKNLEVKASPKEQEEIEIIDPALSPEEEVIRDQDNELVDACIEGLSDLYREAMKLYHIDHLAYNEIAEKLGLTLNTVKTRIRRAKEMVSKAIQEIEEESKQN